MKRNELVGAMSKLEITAEARKWLIDSCLEKSRRNKTMRNRKIAVAVIAILVFSAISVLGIPRIAKSDDGIEIVPGNSMTITAYASGNRHADLNNNVGLLIPPGDCFSYQDKVINGKKITVITGMQAPDICVVGTNIDSVVYSSHNATLFCEFDSKLHNEAGEYIWASSYAIVPVDKYGSWISDMERPEKEELVRILEDLHAERDLVDFYDKLYGNKNLTDAEYAKKCTMPLAFSDYELSLNPAISWWDYKKYDGEVMLIGIQNTGNPTVAPVNASTVDASAGDTVSWYLGTEELMAKYFHVDISTIDLTEITDTIDITVMYTDGSSESASVLIQCSETGEISITKID